MTKTNDQITAKTLRGMLFKIANSLPKDGYIYGSMQETQNSLISLFEFDGGVLNLSLLQKGGTL